MEHLPGKEGIVSGARAGEDQTPANFGQLKGRRFELLEWGQVLGTDSIARALQRLLHINVGFVDAGDAVARADAIAPRLRGYDRRRPHRERTVEAQLG